MRGSPFGLGQTPTKFGPSVAQPLQTHLFHTPTSPNAIQVVKDAKPPTEGSRYLMALKVIRAADRSGVWPFSGASGVDTGEFLFAGCDMSFEEHRWLFYCSDKMEWQSMTTRLINDLQAKRLAFYHLVVEMAAKDNVPIPQEIIPANPNAFSPAVGESQTKLGVSATSAHTVTAQSASNTGLGFGSACSTYTSTFTGGFGFGHANQGGTLFDTELTNGMTNSLQGSAASPFGGSNAASGSVFTGSAGFGRGGTVTQTNSVFGQGSNSLVPNPFTVGGSSSSIALNSAAPFGVATAQQSTTPNPFGTSNNTESNTVFGNPLISSNNNGQSIQLQSGLITGSTTAPTTSSSSAVSGHPTNSIFGVSANSNPQSTSPFSQLSSLGNVPNNTSTNQPPAPAATTPGAASGNLTAPQQAFPSPTSTSTVPATSNPIASSEASNPEWCLRSFQAPIFESGIIPEIPPDPSLCT